jgi:hypothetical protein
MTNLHRIREWISSAFASGHLHASQPWAKTGSYPARSGNELQILIDGQAAYREIAAGFQRARKFIFLTTSRKCQCP